ncbi:MAG TPA: hypothetical protein VGF61_20280 [Candidatus Acidoferrum sp.]
MDWLIAGLSKKEKRELLADLNYLNTGEIKAFCKKHGIPCRIAVETKDDGWKKTNEDDRKGVMLNRVRHFLRTGRVLPETRFRSAVVCFEAIPEELAARDRLFYGRYDKRNRAVMGLLKELTGGEFADGAIARILAREYWSRGEAPTFQEYAAAWLMTRKEHRKPNAEWAYLSDLAGKRNVAEWKKMRARKAKEVMKTIGKIRAGARENPET